MHKNKSFKQSIKNAISGLVFLVKKERNTRFHMAATIIIVLVSALLQLSPVEWLFIILAIFLVWIAEAYNTALEKLFDLVEPGDNGLVKAGKDISAAAVLLTAILSIIVGIVILGPPIFQFIWSFLK